MSLPYSPDDHDDDTSRADQIELLSFAIAGQDYAIDIMRVREIRNWTAPTPLPRTPDYVRGVINLRGTVLPILDLATRLDLESRAHDERSVFVVIHCDKRVFGVTVDGVSDILTVPRSMLQEPPAIEEPTDPGCVSALILEEDRMIRVLDASRIAPALPHRGQNAPAA